MSRAPADAPRHRGRVRRAPRAWAAVAVVAASLLAVASSGDVPALAQSADAVPGEAWTPSTPLVQDAFEAAGPDAPASGHGLWTSPGVRVAPGSGQLDVTGLGPGSSFSLTAPGAPARDVLVSTTVTARPTGGSYYAGTAARVQKGGSRYAATATVRPSGEVVLTAQRVTGGGTSLLGRATTGAAGGAAGAPLRLELSVAGSAPTTVRARVWREGDQAPQWQVSGTDAAEGEITGSGAVTVAGYLSRSASGAEVTLGDLDVWSLAPAATTGAAPTGEVTAAAPPSSAPPSSAPPAEVPTTAPPSAAAPSSSSSAPAPVASARPVPAPAASSAPTTSSTSPAGFTHPGVLVSSRQLVFVRAQIAAGREPWTSALARTRGSFYARAGWVPRPVAQVRCGAYNDPDIGCSAETDDAQAAYTNALLHSLTGEQRYADTAIRILDAWSGTLQGHSFDTTLYRNGRLQAAWAGQTFTKAAELLRYSRAGWSPASAERFERMLRTAFLPLVRDGGNGCANCQMSMAEATTNIGVFLDDRAVFDEGISDWRAQLPAAFYLSSDGAKPVVPPGSTVKPTTVDSYWKFPSHYVDGLGAETCRDLGHTAMGLAGALNTAETAQIQGVDLFEEQRPRLVAAMELTARYLVDPGASGWVCPAPPKAGGNAARLTFEVGLSHYGGEDGIPLPSTRAWVQQNRPTGSGIFMNWETLTHGS